MELRKGHVVIEHPPRADRYFGAQSVGVLTLFTNAGKAHTVHLDEDSLVGLIEEAAMTLAGIRRANRQFEHQEETK